MRQLPLISIPLCVYNGERYLDEQIRSLLAQSHQHFEIIAVDDCSSDGSLALLERYARDEPRIQIHRNHHNLGVNANFDHALSLCRGTYIAPCDQDDIWHPDKLSLLVEALDQHLLVYCDSELIDGSGRAMHMRISDRLNMYEGNDPRVFTFWNCVSGHAMMFRKELVELARPIPDVKFFDWWLAFVASAKGSIKYVDAPLVAYRQHENAQTDLSRSHKKAARHQNRMLELYEERERWLHQLCSLDCMHHRFFADLHALWKLRRNQWLAPRLCSFIWKSTAPFMFINKRESQHRFALKQLWGTKLKSLLIAAD